jgi:flagellar protein FlaG
VPLDAITPTSAVAATSGVRSGTGSPVPQPAPAPAATGDKAQAAQGAEVDAARQKANEELGKNGLELAFEFDDAAGRVVARLIDTKTKEVLRQVPSREMLVIARALADERSRGVLLLTKA